MFPNSQRSGAGDLQRCEILSQSCKYIPGGNRRNRTGPTHGFANSNQRTRPWLADLAVSPINTYTIFFGMESTVKSGMRRTRTQISTDVSEKEQPHLITSSTLPYQDVRAVRMG
jgi:hypothetical protein